MKIDYTYNRRPVVSTYSAPFCYLEGEPVDPDDELATRGKKPAA